MRTEDQIEVLIDQLVNDVAVGELERHLLMTFDPDERAILEAFQRGIEYTKASVRITATQVRRDRAERDDQMSPRSLFGRR